MELRGLGLRNEVQVGPDLVLAGSARSGTSALAALLGAHPRIDAGAVKEPNYFSLRLDHGSDWYDGLYLPRHPDMVRLDSSMTYTYPTSPHALAALAAAAPHARVVYAVRHPIDRMLSHLALRRDFFRNEAAQDLGAALDGSPDYAGASDYSRWLAELVGRFTTDRVLVVPFSVVTRRRREAVEQVCRLVGLEAVRLDEEVADLHRNAVVTYRLPGVERARRLVGGSGLYPTVRRVVGAHRLRTLRNWVTRDSAREPLVTALASCSPQQRERLQVLMNTAQAAVAGHLAAQDVRLGLTWSEAWHQECPPGAVL